MPRISRSLRRPLPAAALFLGLGAVTTVFVAWLVVLLPSSGAATNPAGYFTRGDPTVFIRLDVGYDWGMSHHAANRPSTTGMATLLHQSAHPPRPMREVAAHLPFWVNADWLTAVADRPTDTDWTRAVTGFGWPMRALYWRWEQDHGPGGALRLEYTLDTPSWLVEIVGGKRSLPLRIQPLGFAVNTLVAAAFWFALWHAGARTLRALRRKPGHCKCGYLLTGLPAAAPCPECGRAQRNPAIVVQAPC